MVISEVISGYMRDQGISTRQLARRIGLRNHTTLWRMMDGQSPQGSTLGTVLSWLLSHSVKPTKSNGNIPKSQQRPKRPAAPTPR